MSTILEQRLLVVWHDAPYCHFGRCATGGCTHDDQDKPLLVAGVNLSSLVCEHCFLEEHDGKLPNYRRQPRRVVA